MTRRIEAWKKGDPPRDLPLMHSTTKFRPPVPVWARIVIAAAVIGFIALSALSLAGF